MLFLKEKIVEPRVWSLIDLIVLVFAVTCVVKFFTLRKEKNRYFRHLLIFYENTGVDILLAVKPIIFYILQLKYSIDLINKAFNIINLGYGFWNLISSFIKYQDIHKIVQNKQVNHKNITMQNYK